MAERTGLEPATPGVTGRYSNQLNYRSALEPSGTFRNLCGCSEQCPDKCLGQIALCKGVVGAEGIEPTTFAL